MCLSNASFATRMGPTSRASHATVRIGIISYLDGTRVDRDQLVKNFGSILKNPLIASCIMSTLRTHERGDSMHRRNQGLLLVTLATLTAILGIMVDTYAVSSNNTALSDSTALYAFDIASMQSNTTCRIMQQPWMANRTDTAHPPPLWMANLTDQQRQTLNETVKSMKAAGSTPEQIRSAVNQLFKQWGINIPEHNGRPPAPFIRNSTGGNPPPPRPWMTNSTYKGRPPPWMANQTGTKHSSPPWMANLTTQQKQTLDETVKKMQASGATREQIRNAVNELLKQWGITTPQCH
jgi:predicted lactoylglutathione lyase